MSALAKSAIVAKIRSGDLVISPILSKGQLGGSSVDLRMGTVALMARAGYQSHVDPTRHVGDAGQTAGHKATQRKAQKHERFDVPFHTSFLLHPGALVLVPTLEWIQIPPTLQGIVTARSSWAREGLNIATATIINPGYQGIITLELANFGEIPIALYPGLRLAQIAFYELVSVDPIADTKEARRGQFQMSFEPKAGDITHNDEAFIPSSAIGG